MPRVFSWISTFRSKVSDDFGPQTLAEFMIFASRKWKTQKTWAIYSDGELGGLITFERISPWLGTAHWIFKPDFQGKGIAARASRIAVAEMFESGIGKLAVYPLAGNLAIGSLLTGLGAKREGTLIEQTVCNGKPTDIWVYGLTKSQFEEKENALGSSNTSNHRGNFLRSRRSLAGAHHDPDANPVSGDAGATEAAPGVLDRPDERAGAGNGIRRQSD
jgi:RimJ/RimL family protein N-acetyltransferase